MSQRHPQKLSAGELELMSLLWEQGPLSLSEAHEAVGRPIGYTTVQTRLNRLVEKGLVNKSPERPAKYAAHVRQQQVSAGHLNDLVDRVAGGSVVPLVAHLVGDRKFTPEEIAELKELIRAAERRTKGRAQR